MPLVQNHIHLSTNLEVVGELAPSLKWKASDRIEIPRAFLSIQYAQLGNPRLHVLKHSGDVVQPTDFKFILRVEDDYGMTVSDRKALLRSFMGQAVFFCDVYHPDDGEVHTPAVRTMFCDTIGEFKQFVTTLDRYFVEVSLIDAHTVT